MCIDAERQVIYLMGGWDGNDDLADFWMFDINRKSWKLMSRDTELDGGPCARSCHKMCLDHKRKLIFMLGRYLDSEVRSTMSLKVFDHFVIMTMSSYILKATSNSTKVLEENSVLH